MPFIPHTENDVAEMLASIGAKSIEDLFDEIPQGLRCAGLSDVPEGQGEMAVSRLMAQRAAEDGFYLNFIIETLTGAATPEVDSMTVAGHKLELRRGFSLTVIYFSGRITDATLNWGDTADIVIYTPFGIDSCRLCLVGEIEFYDWAQEPPWDTVGVNTGFELAWHDIAGVNYYSVRMHLVPTAVSTSSSDFADEQIDTVVTIAAEENDVEGYWTFYIEGFGGIDMEGNTSDYSGSGAVVWRLYTRTPWDELIIYVDDGIVTAVSKGGDL